MCRQLPVLPMEKSTKGKGFLPSATTLDTKGLDGRRPKDLPPSATALAKKVTFGRPLLICDSDHKTVPG